MNDLRKKRFLGSKRMILVIDEEASLDYPLYALLSDNYDLITVDDPADALHMVYENSDKLSLVMMDIQMMKDDGVEILKTIRDDPTLHHIPAVVLSLDQEYEVECLRAGAADYIKKSNEYCMSVFTRIQRTIDSYENSYILKNTETDSLSGLYNLDYFFQYAEQHDRLCPDEPMDAVSVDISKFHIINELYGRSEGNRILSKLAHELDVVSMESKGIACRKGADIFLLYLPHRSDYYLIRKRLQTAITEGEHFHQTVRLKMGIYPNVDKNIDIRMRFDRTKFARDTIHNNYAQIIAYYDNSLHQKNLMSQRLMSELDTALSEQQFKVYFQPLYSLESDVPRLVSAEALVRWHHPELGVLSPGSFVPLFEENSLIPKLDRYVWTETARRIREWRDKFGFTLPISVNVSRIDMFDPDFINILTGIVINNGLEPKDILLEITESAYTETSEQIVYLAKQLRSSGFKVAIDDFGSGYSSLNMLSSLPIDAIKLDMAFIRNSFTNEISMGLLRLIMQIKNLLNIPIVAEGVETAEQLEKLKSVGCDVIQGYYFSKPLPPEEFEKFILQEMEKAS